MGTTFEAELRARARESSIDMQGLARLLDAATHDERVAGIRTLGRTEQRRLYAAADGFAPVRLAELVLPGTADGATVRHYGKNTLPALTHFEKRFCRPADQDALKPDRLYGFNYQSTAWATGPGYFTAIPAAGREEVWVDYQSLPPAAPDGWPALRSNERGLSRFVYGYMVDTLRRVSRHVTVGSAARRGRDLGSWFLLCREE